MIFKIFKKYSRIILIILLLGILIIVIYLFTTFKSSNKLVVRFLDIGQGDSILITLPDRENILIDAGPNDTVIQKLEKYLPIFTRKLNYIIPTHPDMDHVAGFIPILKKYQVKNIFLNGDMEQDTTISKKLLSDINLEIENSKAKKRIINCGDKMSLNNSNTDPADDLNLYFLHPTQNNLISNETNANSIVILLTFENYALLFTGDIDQEVEAKLFFNIQKCFKNNDLLQIENSLKNLTILKVAHHGSKYSSSQNFLKEITPEYSIISAGLNNRYGHPDQEVLVRLKKYSKYTISTIERGDIIFKIKDRNIEIITNK